MPCRCHVQKKCENKIVTILSAHTCIHLYIYEVCPYAYARSDWQPFPVPREMTVDEIKICVEQFRQGALNCIKAGFDGVEVRNEKWCSLGSAEVFFWLHQDSLERARAREHN